MTNVYVRSFSILLRARNTKKDASKIALAKQKVFLWAMAWLCLGWSWTTTHERCVSFVDWRPPHRLKSRLCFRALAITISNAPKYLSVSFRKIMESSCILFSQDSSWTALTPLMFSYYRSRQKACRSVKQMSSSCQTRCVFSPCKITFGMIRSQRSKNKQLRNAYCQTYTDSQGLNSC